MTSLVLVASGYMLDTAGVRLGAVAAVSSWAETVVAVAVTEGFDHGVAGRSRFAVSRMMAEGTG